MGELGVGEFDTDWKSGDGFWKTDGGVWKSGDCFWKTDGGV